MEPQEARTEPSIGDLRTITWMKGRNDSPVTWELGKLGVLAREATERPAIGDQWVVRVVKDTAPGERGGVLILMPVKRVDVGETAIVDDHTNELAVDDITNVVQLVASGLCEGSTVKVERPVSTRLVRYTIESDQDARWLFGHEGATIEALRAVVAAMLLRLGLRGWVDFGAPPPVATCACGEVYRDPVDFDERTTGPTKQEERFEQGRPTYYAARACRCGATLYRRVGEPA